MRTFLVVVAGLAATGVVVERAAADGRHGYVFGGWTGTISYQYTRSDEQLSDPLHEYRRHVAVVGTLTIPVAADPTFTVGWDEVSEARSAAFCIPPTSAELITTGTTINRTTGKGGRTEETAFNVASNSTTIAFDVPASDVTYTEETTFAECPYYQPKTQTWAATALGGEVFTMPTRLQDPGVPKLLGSIERSKTDANGSIREVWKVGYDLQACGEHAGPRWMRHFPADNRIEALNEPFRSNVARFVRALRAAGARVTIANVYRPQPRAYLMHYAWRVAYGRSSASGRYSHLEPPAVPKYDGAEKVPICWSVPGLDGKYSRKLSIRAARELTAAYGIVAGHGAAYPSNHSGRTAIDMNISWAGTLRVQGGPRAPFNGAAVELPADGAYWIANGSGIRYVTPGGTPPPSARVRSDQDMNQRLWALGRSYGVLKYVNAQNADPPHWSATGT